MRFLLLLVILPLASAWAQPSVEMLAKQAMADHRYNDVIELLADQSADPELQRVLALAYRESGRTAEALNLLRPLLEADSSNTQILLALGETYSSRQNYREAYLCYRKLCHLHPEVAYYHKRAGKIASALGTGKVIAVNHYQEALKINPLDRDAAYALATLYLDLGQEVSARPITSEFVARDSSDLGMLMLDTRLAYLAERHDQVKSNVEFMLRSGDTLASAIRLYGVSLYQLKEYQSARIWLEYLANLAPSEQVWFYLGMSCYRMADYDLAANYLQKAIEATQSENLGDFYSQLALTRDKSGKVEEALDAYGKAYELTRNPSLLFRMALLYDEELRNYSRAKSFYAQYLDATTESHSTTERLYAEDRLAEIKRAEFMNLKEE